MRLVIDDMLLVLCFPDIILNESSSKQLWDLFIKMIKNTTSRSDFIKVYSQNSQLHENKLNLFREESNTFYTIHLSGCRQKSVNTVN